MVISDNYRAANLHQVATCRLYPEGSRLIEVQLIHNHYYHYHYHY